MSETPIKPIGHKILVKPDRGPVASEGGILIPDAYQNTPPMSGIVVRVGDGWLRDRRTRSAAIARCLAILDESAEATSSATHAMTLAREEMGRYLMSIGSEESVARVGDRVIFPMEVGHEIVLGERTEDAVVIVSEESILAVCEPAEETAA